MIDDQAITEKIKKLKINRRRIIGAICRFVSQHRYMQPKGYEDSAILKKAAENAVNKIKDIDFILSYDPHKFSKSIYIDGLSMSVCKEYAKLITEKHPHLKKRLAPKPRPHARLRV